MRHARIVMLACGLALAAAVPGSAMAQAGAWSFGVAGGQQSIDGLGPPGVSVPVAVVRGGYQATPHLGVELEAGFGLDDTFESYIRLADLRTLAVFGVASMPVGSKGRIYARAGALQLAFSAYNILALAPITPGLKSERGALAAGAGGEWALSETGAVRLDWLWSRTNDDRGPFWADRLESHAVSLGYVHRF
jgi:Outer membrane protein beta-barrel domain